MRAERRGQSRELKTQYHKPMTVCKQTVGKILYINISTVRQVGDKPMSSSSKTPPDAISECDVEERLAEGPISVWRLAGPGEARHRSA